MAGVAASKSMALPQGVELGHYRLLSKIGQGGFGITYLAQHVQTGEQVVVKENLPTFYATRNDATLQVLPLDVEDAAENYAHTLRRFVDEARLLAHLHHPNIVRVTDAFEALGTAYYVMPYIRGQELHKAAPAVVTETWLRPILCGVLSALEYLHGQNLLHRDIKPGNILLTEGGTPILIDFGTARALLSDRSATMVGTPGYTPIEQVTTHGKCGPWTDIYALGATCYRLITGERPPDSVDMLANESLYRPLSSRPELQDRFSAAFLQGVDKALAVSLEKRYHRVQEWIHAMDCLQAEAVAFLPASHEQEKPVTPHRSKLPFILSGCGLLIVAAVSASYVYYQSRESEQKALLLVQRERAAADRRASVAEAEFRAKEAAALQALEEAEKLAREAAESRAQEESERKAREESERLAREKAELRAKAEAERLARVEAEKQARIKACQDYVNSLESAYAKRLNFEPLTLPQPETALVVETLRTLAEQGQSDEQWALAVLLEHGIGMQKNEAEAVTWYRRAAEQSNARAQCCLGWCYANGCGVRKDVRESEKWYRMADVKSPLQTLICDLQSTHYSNATHKLYQKRLLMVLPLIADGADVDTNLDTILKKSNGTTALHNACGLGHYEIVKWLLENGADVHKRATNGATPDYCLADKDDPGGKIRALLRRYMKR